MLKKNAGQAIPVTPCMRLKHYAWESSELHVSRHEIDNGAGLQSGAACCQRQLKTSSWGQCPRDMLKSGDLQEWAALEAGLARFLTRLAVDMTQVRL